MSQSPEIVVELRAAHDQITDKGAESYRLLRMGFGFVMNASLAWMCYLLVFAESAALSASGEAFAVEDRRCRGRCALGYRGSRPVH